MNCKKCGSKNIQVTSDTSGKIKKRGCLMNLVHILLIILTFGLWLIIPLLTGGSKGKIKTNTKAVCMNCGYKWIIWYVKNSAYFCDITKVSIDAPLNVDNIKNIIENTGKFLNEINYELDRSIQMRRYNNSDDYKQLLLFINTIKGSS